MYGQRKINYTNLEKLRRYLSTQAENGIGKTVREVDINPNDDFNIKEGKMKLQYHHKEVKFA